MTNRPSHRAVIVVAGVALALAANAGPAAADRSLSVAYDLYGSGFKILTMDARFAVDADSYAMDVTSQTVGLFGLILPFASESAAAGSLNGVAVSPDSYRLDADWLGRERLIEMTYADDGRIAVHVVPDPAAEGREPVPEELKRATLDPISGAVAVMHALGRGEGCDRTVPVFDGRRRWNIIFEEIGPSRIAPSSYSSYSGPAILCAVRSQRVKGFSDRLEFDPDLSEAVHVWLASVAEGLPPVPVRLEADSRYGSLRMHLRSAFASDQPGAVQRSHMGQEPSRPVGD